MKSTLRSGSTVSHYRLLSLVGAGGMGEVYKAEDTTLGRTIALKILPPELVQNSERLHRFVQEARSASSLSHPNIVTVHEIGEARVRPNGEPDEGEREESSVHYIAMEFVEGDTLRAKIHDEKTELRVLLVYLAQAAEGLAKAHAAGIVHRDLKPDNIMITRDGYAKVLDFGLAKLTESQPSSSTGQTTDATTAAGSPTRAGAVLGTVGYMSPEQVQGKSVDARSDIFSFGCILYEAAAGQRPFQGDTDIEVMHKILREKPVPVDQLNPDVPGELRRLIRRCLAKDPEQRYQSMKDLAIELNDLAQEYDQLSPGSSSGSSVGELAPVRGRGPRSWVRMGALALMLVAAVLGGAYLLGRRAGAPGEPVPFESMRITSLTGSGKVRDAAISPDGKVVVQAVEEAGKQSLRVRQVATGSDVEIVAAGTPFGGIALTPDGNYVYYTRSERDVRLYSLLYQVPVLGGTPRKLIFDVDTPVTFSPDGSQIAFARGYPDENSSAILVAAADGTGERKIAERKDPEPYDLSVLAWSPDGKTIAAVATSIEGGEHSIVVVVDVASGDDRPLGGEHWANVGGLAWLPDGTGLIVVASTEESVNNRQIWHIGYPGGEPRRITNDLNNYHRASLTADARTLVTVQTSFSSNLWLAPAEDAGRARSLALERSEFVEQVRWGRSGKITFLANRNSSIDLWMCDPESGEQKRLTTESRQFFNPLPAADGSFILCTSFRDGGVPHVYRLDPDGGNPTAITRGEGEICFDLSPDDQWMLYVNRGTERTVWKARLNGDEPTEILTEPRGMARFSPDGKMILHGYLRPEGDRYVTAAGIIPALGGDLLHSYDAPEGVGDTRWASTSDAIAYVQTQDGVSNIWRQPLGGGPPEQVTNFESGRIFSFDWSPDGKQIAYSRGEAIGDAVLLSDLR